MLNIRIATPPFDKATGGLMKVNPGICSSYKMCIRDSAYAAQSHDEHVRLPEQVEFFLSEQQLGAFKPVIHFAERISVRNFRSSPVSGLRR